MSAGTVDAGTTMLDAVGEPTSLTDARLRRLLATERHRWLAVHPSLVEVLDALAALVEAGGKRIRPAFCYWGAIGAGGPVDPALLTDVCSAIELIHVFGLVHDDIMDEADERRGVPAVHRRLGDAFASSLSPEARRRVGENLGILAGDLALTLSDGLLDRTPTDVRRLIGDLKSEMCLGQALDISFSARPTWDVTQATTIATYKSAKYSIERPLQVGASLGGGSPELLEQLGEFGVSLGLAFQLHDDLLDLFGDPAVTGKPAARDFAEGKMTPLACLAHAECPDDPIWERFGTGSIEAVDVAEFRRLVVDSRARDVMRSLADDLSRRALEVLDELPLAAPATEHLRAMATALCLRTA